VPFLKINTIYEGFSGLSNKSRISSGGADQHRENRNGSTRNDATSSNPILDFIVFSKTT